MDKQLVCPLCSSTLKPHYPTLGFQVCSSCRLFIRGSDRLELDQMYQEGWEEPETNLKETGGTNIDLARQYIAHLKKMFHLESLVGKRILDFGAGRGDLMAALQAEGCEVVGVEPYGYDYLKSRAYEVYHTLSELDRSRRFDGIVCFDVIEHVDQPWEMISQFGYYLNETGWILLTTPNASSLNSIVTTERWRELYNPGHLLLFNPRNLEMCIEKGGFSNYTRLKWGIDYGRGKLRGLLDRVLLATGLDGELRYLIRKQDRS